MSDIYIPGVSSRFDTEKLIEDLMKVERIPKERAEQNVENLETQKSTWQDVGRRISTLRESARNLYSFQNPFTERLANSSDESVLTGTASREASEQERSFIVKQAAAADRFISTPLDENYQIKEGTYTFTVGKDEISFNFRGGSLRDFSEALNRRGRDRIKTDIITVEPGTRSLIIESLVTGSGNRLGFLDQAETLALETGIAERSNDSRRSVDITTARPPGNNSDSEKIKLSDTTLTLAAGGEARIPISPSINTSGSMVLEFETSVRKLSDEENLQIQAPSGPDIPESGSVNYGGVQIENDPFEVPLPDWTPPPPPPRVDDLNVLSIQFSDGTQKTLDPIQDSPDFTGKSYRLADLAQGKDIVSINLSNKNTHREISVQEIQIYDPEAYDGLKPRAPIETAQDAIVSMDGIEITRSSNTISDLIPGVDVNIKRASDYPVNLSIEPNREAAKESIIALVGNYNRIMAEINVLTRTDDRIIQELSYLADDEIEEFEEKLGTMQGDSTLNQLRSNLQRTVANAYPTRAVQDITILSQLGISTDARGSGSGGYDASRLRGYLEIDEKALDQALLTHLPAIRDLFGMDSDGDLIIDSGFAFTIDSITRPYVETGGIISLRTSGIDTRIDQEERRIENLDKQLASKEADLRRQYGAMEGALNRMESQSTSIEQFNNRSSND